MLKSSGTHMTKRSPRELPRASKPSAWRGCAEILGDPYDKKAPLPRIPNSRPLGSRHNTHMGQYCHTGNSALGQFCLPDNGAVGKFSQQHRDTPWTATSGPQRPAFNLQRSIAFLDTHTKIMSYLAMHILDSLIILNRTFLARQIFYPTHSESQ